MIMRRGGDLGPPGHPSWVIRGRVSCTPSPSLSLQVSDWWEQYIYLRGRSPLMVNSNYYAMVKAGGNRWHDRNPRRLPPGILAEPRPSSPGFSLRDPQPHPSCPGG